MKKCYSCGMNDIKDDFYYCKECLVKIKRMMEMGKNIIKDTKHMNHCISCGEWEDRIIVYVDEVTPVCDKCVEEELKLYD